MSKTNKVVRTRDDLPPGHWLRRQLPAGASLRTYAEERAIINLTRFVNQAAEASDLSRAELANLLGTSRSFVSQVLNGSANMTLKTFGALLWAVGQQVSGVKTEVLGTHAERVDNDNVLRFRVPVSSETRPTGSVADVAIKVVG